MPLEEAAATTATKLAAPADTDIAPEGVEMEMDPALVTDNDMPSLAKKRAEPVEEILIIPVAPVLVSRRTMPFVVDAKRLPIPPTAVKESPPALFKLMF